jgi:hypothetical protein
MALLPFYIKVTPGEINGFLAAQGGKILFHVPNYTELFEQPPVANDESHQVFLVGSPEDEIRTISDGGVQKTYVWKGDPQARSKPQDKASLEILSLVPFVTAVAVMDPVAAAKAAFADMPADVQLAAVIQANTLDTLTALPEISPARASALHMWAGSCVNAFIESQSRSKGG